MSQDVVVELRHRAAHHAEFGNSVPAPRYRAGVPASSVKDVPLLRATAGAHDLKRLRRVAGVAHAAQVIFIERRGEAGPAGAALELRAGLEQGQPAQAAGEHALALLGEEDAAKRFFVAVMKHDAALFIAEAVDQFSELCLTGRRQIKMRRGGGVRHPRSGFPGASNDTVCLVKTAPSGSTTSIKTLCGPRCSPTRMRVLLWP